jgi:hypothetical protein
MTCTSRPAPVLNACKAALVKAWHRASANVRRLDSGQKTRPGQPSAADGAENGPTVTMRTAQLAAAIEETTGTDAGTAHWLAGHVFQRLRQMRRDSGVPDPACPECGTDEWDFTGNDRARCAAGHEFTIGPPARPAAAARAE